MNTTLEKPLEASPRTRVADMPPLEVVTEGIPPQEHVETPGVVQPEAAVPAARERNGRLLAWALAGVMGLLLLVAGIVGLAQNATTGPTDLHMGLTPQAWQEFRAGERASEPVYSGLLRGSALPYMPYWSMPSLASLAPMSIPSIAPIPAMSIPSIAPMSIASIAPIPAMSIPSIAPISIPSNPTPSTPSTGSIPSIPSISVPSIQPISFPSFPSIAPISVPPIESIPSISIPDM